MLQVSIKCVKQPESAAIPPGIAGLTGTLGNQAPENTMPKLSFQSSRTPLWTQQAPEDSWRGGQKESAGSDHHLPTGLAKVYATARRRNQNWRLRRVNHCWWVIVDHF